MAPRDDTTSVSETPTEGSGRLGRNLAALGTGQLFTWTMTLAWTVVVPRLLGPAGLGLIVTGMAVAGILQIALGAGTAVYVTREIVVDPPRTARLVASATIARLLLVPVFMAAAVVWVLLAHYGARGNIVLLLIAGGTVLTMLTEPLQSFFQAVERMQYIAISGAINKAAQGLVGIGLTLLGFGAIGFGGCLLVMSIVVFVLCLRWARRYIRLEFRTTVADLRAVLRGSLVYWATGVFFTIYLWIDTAMLSLMTRPTVVGWYGVPTRLFTTMLFIPTLVSTAWLPRLVAAFQGSRDDLHRAARVPVGLVLALAMPIGGAIVVGAAPVIDTVYGQAYRQAVPVLIILGLGLIPMYLNIMLSAVCVAGNRQGRWAWLMVGATVFNPALNAWLIPLTEHRYGNGAIGAALALALTELAIAIAGVVVAGRTVLGRSELSRVIRATVASAGMCAVGFATRSAGAIPSLFAAGLSLPVLALLVRAVTVDELRPLLASARRMLASRRPGRGRAPVGHVHLRPVPSVLGAGAYVSGAGAGARVQLEVSRRRDRSVGRAAQDRGVAAVPVLLRQGKF